MDREALLDRARTRGVNPVVYWIVRSILQPFFHVYFRLGRIGREHIPPTGPVILAANHRSFLDPFVIAVMARRPIYFVAKKEIFLIHPAISWLLNALGAFPIDRGGSDHQAMATAKAILDRGDAVLMFPEGTRIRPGSLGRPKRGVGRLALETGAPVVPVAVIGTEAVRNGWRFRPHKVRIRAGRPLTFPKVERPSPGLGGAVTDRIWPCVELQWEWLGGLPRVRRAAVIGAGAPAIELAAALARAGLEVELGTRRAGPPLAVHTLAEPRPPAVELGEAVHETEASALELQRHDLVCFAVPAHDLEAAVAEHGPRIPARAAVLLALDGPDDDALAAVERSVRARAVGGVHVAGTAALEPGAEAVVTCADPALHRQLRDVLRAGGLRLGPAEGAVDESPTRVRRSRAA